MNILTEKGWNVEAENPREGKHFITKLEMVGLKVKVNEIQEATREDLRVKTNFIRYKNAIQNLVTLLKEIDKREKYEEYA